MYSLFRMGGYTRYDYEANSNLTKVTTPKGFEIRRSYDADDRLTEERVIDKKNGIDRRVQYVYDEAGNVLKRTVLGADGERLETGFCYDLKDRLTRRTNPGGAALRYLYDRNDTSIKQIFVSASSQLLKQKFRYFVIKI